VRRFEETFAVGASMKLLYENGQWALLPEDRIIEKYYAKLSAGGTDPRSEFPIIDVRGLVWSIWHSIVTVF
jgi:hypothetical protein